MTLSVRASCTKYHRDNIGDNKYCDKWDLMLLLCHITLYNHLFKWSYNFLFGFMYVWLYGWLLIVRHNPAKFGSHTSYGSRDKTDLIFHLTLQGHLIKGSYDFMKVSSSLYVPNPVKFSRYRHCGNGYITILVCNVILRLYECVWLYGRDYKTIWLYGNVTLWLEAR